VQAINLKSPPIIKGQDFTKEEKEFARRNNKILIISPCVGKRCNFFCPFCYANSGKEEAKNQLTLSEYKQIICDARELGTKTVRIAGWGEPFCDINFFDPMKIDFPIIDFANSRGLYVVFFTNGSMITEKIAEKLIQKNVSIIAKMNSLKKDVQDWMAGRDGAFEMMQDGIKNLIKVGFNKFDPPRFGVESIICKKNYKELPKIFILLREQNILPYFEIIMHGGRGKDDTFHLSKDEAKTLFMQLLKIDETKFNYTWFPAPPYVGFPCDKLFYNLVVSDNGNTYPCYGIDINMGNIRENPLKKILKNPKLLKIRNMMKEMHGNCAHCAHHDKCFFGCRCDAFQHGDVFGNYHECWHSYTIH